MSFTREMLESAAHENWAINQGVDPEVMRDLGYTLPEDLDATINDTLARQEAASEPQAPQPAVSEVDMDQIQLDKYVDQGLTYRQAARRAGVDIVHETVEPVPPADPQQKSQKSGTGGKRNGNRGRGKRYPDYNSSTIPWNER